jgi:predicted RNA-binding Zn-ribbon protein involved in translation (DUF1610 family)
MKPSRFTIIGMAVFGAVLLVWLAFLVYTLTQPTRTSTAVDEQHCPVCGRELPRWAQKAKQCPYCQAEGRDLDISNARAGGSLFSRPIIPIGLVCGFVILLGVHVFLQLRARALKKPEEAVYHMYCTKCRRKLRYRERQIGHFGRCPLCGKPILFPKPRQLAPLSGWGKMKRWLKIGSG